MRFASRRWIPGRKNRISFAKANRKTAFMMCVKTGIIYGMQIFCDVLLREKRIIDTLIELLKTIKKVIDLFRLFF
jgi:hypothetical protein